MDRPLPRTRSRSQLKKSLTIDARTAFPSGLGTPGTAISDLKRFRRSIFVFILLIVAYIYVTNRLAPNFQQAETTSSERAVTWLNKECMNAVVLINEEKGLFPFLFMFRTLIELMKECYSSTIFVFLSREALLSVQEMTLGWHVRRPMLEYHDISLFRTKLSNIFGSSSKVLLAYVDDPIAFDLSSAIKISPQHTTLFALKTEIPKTGSPPSEIVAAPLSTTILSASKVVVFENSPRLPQGAMKCFSPCILGDEAICSADAVFECVEKFYVERSPDLHFVELKDPTEICGSAVNRSSRYFAITCLDPMRSRGPWNKCHKVLLPEKSNLNQELDCDWLDDHRRIKFHICPHAIGPPLAESDRPALALATQLTLDRLDRLEAIAAAWDGPISAALYVTDQQSVDTWRHVAASPVLSRRRDVRIHMVSRCGPLYPINHLRNIAARLSGARHVFAVDTDMLPSVGLYHQLLKIVEAKTAELKIDQRIQKVVHIVPAFEFASSVGEEELERMPVPRTKEELWTLYQSKKAVTFWSETFPAAYAPTRADKYFASSSPYNVTYHPRFEPYIMMDIVTTPVFDEQIMGWGSDKAILHVQLDLAGYTWVVDPSAGFVFHVETKPKPHSPNQTQAQSPTQSWGKYSPEAPCNGRVLRRYINENKARKRPA